MQDKTGGKQSGKSGADARDAKAGATGGKTAQSSSQRKEERARTAALTFPQPVRKEALQADESRPREAAGATKAAKAKPRPKAAGSAARPGSQAAKTLQPVDPMTLMMPFMKAGVAYSTSMVNTQIKLYDMAMKATPLGAMARQQANYNKMMTQAMFQMTPWGMRGRKTGGKT